MTAKINYAKHSGEMQKLLMDFSAASSKTLDATLLDLIHIRASQVNGCAFCLDMHVKEAKIHGERELRLHHLMVWRESQLFTPKERAVLDLTEVVTKLSGHGISDEVFKNASEYLSEKEISDTIFAIGVINFWNRLQISSPTTPGAYDEMFGLTKAGLK